MEIRNFPRHFFPLFLLPPNDYDDASLRFKLFSKVGLAGTSFDEIVHNNKRLVAIIED